MQYEWDSRKAARNRRIHGVDLVDAIPAIEDPNRLEEIELRFDYAEDRMRIVGMAFGRVLFVVAAIRGDVTCRIVSARKATRDEQDRYFTSHR